MPAGLLGNELPAERTDALLFLPEGEEGLSMAEVIHHLLFQSLLKVKFPGWVVGIGRGADFDVSSNRNFGGLEKLDGVFLVLGFCLLVRENPLPATQSGKVAVANPTFGFT